MHNPKLALDDCFLHDRDRLRHGEALDLLRARLIPIADVETVALSTAHGRVVAKDITAPHPVPLHTNSAVDGYALNHADVDNATGPLPISQRIAAGMLSPQPLARGTAVRIFTGAVMPEGANTVAMQEDCETQSTGNQNRPEVRLPTNLKLGANCRKAGEDLALGETVLQAGTVVRASHIAAAASVGTSELCVFKPLRIALFSNGDELRDAEEASPTPLRLGQVFDTNSPMLAGLVRALPVDVVERTIIPDGLKETESALVKASQTADIIITSGGASRGEEDHMLTALDRLGKRHLWQLAIKPGRPMIMGQIARGSSQADCLYFGLPGNPVAAFVCFLLYVRPSLLALAGAPFAPLPRYTIESGFEISSKKPDRREFLRAKRVTLPDGRRVVQKFARDGSGLISSLHQSDGLVEIPEDVTQIALGDPVTFIPYPDGC
ncbi:MAG: gephyrin-like molybdotransferase Glp [Pseudomonadota bacterium]